MTLGKILDNLDCRSTTLKDSDLVESAIVIMKVVDEDGNVRLSVCWSEGLNWIERWGMVQATVDMTIPY